MKNKILDAAEELFITQGFDNTSTNDIIKKAGIVRGTLYNHFKSKEDVLDGVIERIINQMTLKATTIADNRSIPILERITMTIMSLNIESVLKTEVLEQMHKPQNALMHQKAQEMTLTNINPIIVNLVKEGISEGIFNTDYPKEAVEMIMLYSYVVFDDLNDESPELMQKRILGFTDCAEKLLGTQKGTLLQTIMMIINKQ